MQRKPGVGKAKQELDSLVKNVLDKRADTKIARMADEMLKGKLRNPEMFDDLKALIVPKAK